MFKGFLCEISGEPILASNCLACASNGAPQGCDMTGPVIRGILKEKRPDDFGLSVTTALGCPRSWRLKMAYDYYTAPSAEWWIYRGQALHEAAEKHAAAKGVLAERRLNFLVPLGERMPEEANDHVALVGDHVVLTGKPDLVDVERGHIIDYKTTKKVPLRHYTYTCPRSGEVLREGKFPARYDFSCSCGETHPGRDIQTIGPPQARQDHLWQLAIYTLMLEENGQTVQTAEVVYQSMQRQKRILVPAEELSQHKAEVQRYLAEVLPLFTQADIPRKAEVPKRVKWQCKKYCAVAEQCQGDVSPCVITDVGGQTAEDSLRELGF